MQKADFLRALAKVLYTYQNICGDEETRAKVAIAGIFKFGTPISKDLQNSLYGNIIQLADYDSPTDRKNQCGNRLLWEAEVESTWDTYRTILAKHSEVTPA